MSVIWWIRPQCLYVIIRYKEAMKGRGEDAESMKKKIEGRLRLAKERKLLLNMQTSRTLAPRMIFAHFGRGP